MYYPVAIPAPSTPPMYTCFACSGYVTDEGHSHQGVLLCGSCFASRKSG